jgi:hypothetical protein
METYVIHNVPYYYESSSNKLYVYNDSKLHIGSYDPETHNVIYRTDIPHAELTDQLANWRKSLETTERRSTTAKKNSA